MHMVVRKQDGILPYTKVSKATKMNANECFTGGTLSEKFGQFKDRCGK